MKNIFALVYRPLHLAIKACFISRLGSTSSASARRGVAGSPLGGYLNSVREELHGAYGVRLGLLLLLFL